MEKIYDLDSFADEVASLYKTAGKDRIGRNKLRKQLEKAQSEYSKFKKENDVLEADDRKARVKLEKSRKDTSSARARVMKLHTALSGADLADASEVVFHPEGDVSYLIGGKEYHLELRNDGDLALIPWREHRKSLKPTVQEPIDSEELPQLKIDLELEPSEDEETEESLEENNDDEIKDLTEEDKNDLNDFYRAIWE